MWSFLICNLCIVLVFAILYFVCGSGDPTAFNTPLFPLDALYFAVVTQSTVGFGDIHPVNHLARMLVSLHIVVTVVANGVLVTRVAQRHYRRSAIVAATAVTSTKSAATPAK